MTLSHSTVEGEIGDCVSFVARQGEGRIGDCVSFVIPRLRDEGTGRLETPARSRSERRVCRRILKEH
jgi:hypothetical protein